MRIAALYDIHGNAPALRAVLGEVRAQAPSLVVVGGDVVAGPQPSEVLDLLLGSGLVLRWVMGNADREVLEGSGDEARWVAERLRPEQLALLSTFEPVVSAGGVLFCHGSPRSDVECLTRVTPEARLEEVLAGVRQRTVVCGHTHQQFDRTVIGHRVLNAGSVGLPYEGGELAAYWLSIADDGSPQLHRTPYDAEAARVELLATGAPTASWPFEPVDPDEVARTFEP